jgi:hypothetical protein
MSSPAFYILDEGDDIGWLGIQCSQLVSHHRLAITPPSSSFFMAI